MLIARGRLHTLMRCNSNRSHHSFLFAAPDPPLYSLYFMHLVYVWR
jgi:hypothetical protein